MNDAPTIRPEPPDQPDVMRLIQALDAQMAAVCPPESNHLLDIEALSDPAVTFLVVRDGDDLVGCGALKRDPGGWGEIKRMYETDIHNTEALALYRGAGFVECEPFGDYRADPLSVFVEKRVII